MSALNPTSELAIKRDLLRVETRKLLSIVSVSAEWVEALEPNRIAATKMIEDKRIFWMTPAAVRNMKLSMSQSLFFSSKTPTEIAILEAEIDAGYLGIDDTYFSEIQRTKIIDVLQNVIDVLSTPIAPQKYVKNAAPQIAVLQKSISNIADRRAQRMSDAEKALTSSSIIADQTILIPQERIDFAAIVDSIQTPDDTCFLLDTDRDQVVQAIDDHFDAEYLLLAGETYRASNVPAVIDHINTALGIKTL